MSELSRRQIGPYRLERLLGRGGMGEVYEAYDERLERSVAIKHVRPEGRESDSRLSRFRREARTVARLSHPAIVQVFDVLDTPEGDWIVMEYVEGPTLARLLRGGPLDLSQAVEIARDVAEGLAYAHSQGTIHRDLKAENVMLSPLGRAKILDFGLAKRLLEGDASLTVDGAVLGTCRAMSPEQARGYDLDEKTDLFSFGTLLYECLTATSPFAGDSAVDTLTRVCSHRQVPVRELEPGVPGDLSELVDRLLEKLPEHRPESARQVADQLAAIHFRLGSRAASGAPEEQGSNGSGPLASSPTLASDETTVAAPPVGGHGRTADRRRISRLATAVLAATAVIAAPWTLRVVRGWLPDSGSPVPAGTAPAAEGRAAAGEPLRIVVLPFESLGPRENAYFAAGITEEISRRLAALSGLGVISRTSAARYAGGEKDVRQIGRELDVAYVLEGTVNWPPAGEARVRITPRLIRVADDTHVWTDAYERRPDDFLRVQSEIAAEVVAQLEVTLRGQERQSLEAQATETPAAWFAYLRGLDYRHQLEYSEEGLENAVRMFERAVEEDPGFVEAWAELAWVHAFLYFNSDQSEGRRAAAREALGRARALAPELPEVRRASGYFSYYVERDYPRAAEEFSAALRRLPHDAELLAGLAFVKRRQGELEEAVARLVESFSLDRANASRAANIAETYRALRRYALADRWYAAALELAPDFPEALGQRALNALAWRGCPSEAPDPSLCSLEEARTVLARSPIRDDPRLYPYWLRLDLYATAVSAGESADAYRAILDRAAARSETAEGPGAGCWYFWREIVAHRRLGRLDDARQLAESCRDELLAIGSRGDSSWSLALLGLAHAYLGDRERALAASRRAVELSSEDRYSGPRYVEYEALAYVLLGDHERANDRLERLLAMPYQYALDLASLRLDPVWDPLRSTPRFRRLTSRRVDPSAG